MPVVIWSPLCRPLIYPHSVRTRGGRSRRGNPRDLQVEGLAKHFHYGLVDSFAKDTFRARCSLLFKASASEFLSSARPQSNCRALTSSVTSSILFQSMFQRLSNRPLQKAHFYNGQEVNHPVCLLMIGEARLPWVNQPLLP